MTRDERRRQSAAAIAMCERIGPRLKSTGDPANISDAQLGQMFTGVELRCAQWLRFVAQRCERSNKRTKELA